MAFAYAQALSPDFATGLIRQAVGAFFAYPEVMSAIGAMALAALLILTFWFLRGLSRGAASARIAMRSQQLRKQKDHRAMILIAYFDGIGASGRALGRVERRRASGAGPGLRRRLADHVGSRLSGGEGAIAVTLATGDQSRIGEADAEAMRRSGLAHLLSISGLHVSALIGGVIFLVHRLLALSPRLALHWPILLIAACAGAAAGIGYTLLTGAQVPTVRSCIAALLVIGGLALGREAISLRLIATGALFVMLFWPDAVVGCEGGEPGS